MLDRIGSKMALLLVVVAILVVIVVGWFALVSPQQTKADQLDTQLAAANSELTADQQLLAAPARKQTEAAFKAATRALPETPKMSEILRQLNSFVVSSRTELDTLTPAAPAAVGTGTAIPINLTVTGRYFGLQKFLKLLRTSADVQSGHITGQGRLYSVSSIGFTGGGDGTPISATIVLNAFVYATPPVAAPTTTDTETTASATTGP